MEVIPAIDIRGGRAVRLRQGDYAQETVYEDDPLDAARRWVEQGAAMLHVVDLDGARGGTGNVHHLERICNDVDVPVQFGGGVRHTDTVLKVLRAGAARVVIGTAAYRDEGFLGRAVAAAKGQLAVAVDVKGGKIAVSGWLETEDRSPTQVMNDFAERGVSQFVVTSVDRDGMLAGPDLDLARSANAAMAGGFIYSGGIGSLADLEALRDDGLELLDGVITGKALYENKIDLAAAIKAVG